MRSSRLAELVERFCDYQQRQRGKTPGGVQTYRWNLQQFLLFVKALTGRPARQPDLNPLTIQGWMDDMAAAGLAINTLRSRQSSLSSFCRWLVKRALLDANPVDRLDRPPQQQVPPDVPAPSLMDALIRAAKARGRDRDIAMFLVLRYTAMRREAVARLRLRNLDGEWGFRGVREKGGKIRDIPVPEPVMRFLYKYVNDVLRAENGTVDPETPLFWSTWGRRSIGKVRRPMTGKNIWRLCKVYGRRIGAPTLKPHDFRHGLAMEVLGQRNNLEEVRALLDHSRLDTTQIYTTIRPPQLKHAVAFFDEAAQRVLEDEPQPAALESEEWA
jgi:site-specific recombinase XerD